MRLTKVKVAYNCTYEEALFWYCSEAVRLSLYLKQLDINLKIDKEDLYYEPFINQRILYNFELCTHKCVEKSMR